jgi:hypothetical protein
MNRKIRPVSCGRWQYQCVMAIASLFATTVYATEIDVGNSDVRISWDNTVKYSASWRAENASTQLTSRSNYDDGDRNFGKGMTSNRVDMLSEIDLTYKDLGARVSAAAWYDELYNRHNDNNSPLTVNSVSVPTDRFPQATRTLHGKKGELLDAFIFGKAEFDDMRASARLGRHALLWGESLFFGNNGIAGGQAPIDVVKAQSVPSTTFKELIRPVGQVSGQIQLNSTTSVGAYYQYRWEKTRLPAAGSYFSSTDILDAGGERILAGPTNNGPAFFRGRDLEAKNSGQGGVQLRYSPEGSGVDFGFYAIRFHAKTPIAYIRPGVGFNPLTGQIGDYQLVYPEGIKAFGVSASSTIGTLNLSGELSTRRNTPLVTPPQTVTTTQSADNNGNPAYAIGNSVHAQVSFLYSFTPNALTTESTLVGEVAWNRLASITRNPQALDPGVTRDAWGLRLQYEPFYRQVSPGLDISLPVGVGYFPKGRSAVVSNFGPDKGGDTTFGISGIYRDTWRFGLAYTHYFGSQDTALVPNPSNPAQNINSFKQVLGDRDFVSLTVRTTF